MAVHKKTDLEDCEYCKPKNHLKRWIIIGCLFIFIVIIFTITNQGFPNFFEDKKEISESVSLQNQYDGWKECRNFGLNLSFKIPINWECESNEVTHNIGQIGLKGDGFLVEVENLGRSYGCMADSTCSDTVIYSRDIITLHLISFNDKDDYIFGIFNDSPESRSYGGIVLNYDGIGERKMTSVEKETLFKILDSFVHSF